MEPVPYVGEDVEMRGGEQERQWAWYHRAPGERWQGTTSASTLKNNI